MFLMKPYKLFHTGFAVSANTNRVIGFAKRHFVKSNDDASLIVLKNIGRVIAYSLAGFFVFQLDPEKFFSNDTVMFAFHCVIIISNLFAILLYALDKRLHSKIIFFNTSILLSVNRLLSLLLFKQVLAFLSSGNVIGVNHVAYLIHQIILLLLTSLMVNSYIHLWNINVYMFTRLFLTQFFLFLASLLLNLGPEPFYCIFICSGVVYYIMAICLTVSVSKFNLYFTVFYLALTAFIVFTVLNYLDVYSNYQALGPFLHSMLKKNNAVTQAALVAQFKMHIFFNMHFLLLSLIAAHLLSALVNYDQAPSKIREAGSGMIFLLLLGGVCHMSFTHNDLHLFYDQLNLAANCVDNAGGGGDQPFRDDRALRSFDRLTFLEHAALRIIITAVLCVGLLTLDVSQLVLLLVMVPFWLFGFFRVDPTPVVEPSLLSQILKFLKDIWLIFCKETTINIKLLTIENLSIILIFKFIVQFFLNNPSSNGPTNNNPPDNRLLVEPPVNDNPAAPVIVNPAPLVIVNPAPANPLFVSPVPVWSLTPEWFAFLALEQYIPIGVLRAPGFQALYRYAIGADLRLRVPILAPSPQNLRYFLNPREVVRVIVPPVVPTRFTFVGRRLPIILNRARGIISVVLKSFLFFFKK